LAPFQKIEARGSISTRNLKWFVLDVLTEMYDDDELDVDRLALRNLMVFAIVSKLLEDRSEGIRTVFTDSSKGERLTNDLRTSDNDTRIFQFTRLKRHVFEALLRWLISRGYLKDGKSVSAAEKLMIFLHMSATGRSYRSLQEDFHHSMATLSRCIHEVMVGLLALHEEVVRVPDETAPVPRWIADNSKFAKYFHDCIGALDGSHVPAHVKGDEIEAYRNRKGTTTQNVLAVCDFDGQFIYIYAGWEGSAHDMRVLEEAKDEGFGCPKGRYYLADAGYTNTDMTLVPYRGTRYHLKEWETVSRRPSTKEELFNLRHSSLRNHIERSFGVLKARWQVFRKQPQYSLTFQKQLVYALTAVNNFIRQQGQNDIMLSADDIAEGAGEGENNYEGDTRIKEDRDSSTMAQKREVIAELMWKDYKRYLEARGMSVQE